MVDNYRVLDCLVSELQANLNMWAGEFTGIVWNIYDRTVVEPCPLCEGKDPDCKGTSSVVNERRATVVMSRLAPMPVALPPGFDPRGNRRN